MHDNDTHEDTDAAEPVVEQQAPSNTLETLLDEHQVRDDPPPAPAPTCLMGQCVDDRHPTLIGRVLVRWTSVGGQEQRRWLPTLQGLPVRSADRVLMLRPEGSDELVVTGVVDGFARRPPADTVDAGTIELRRDERVRVVGAQGQPLLELQQGESGPVLTLLHDDLELAAPGRVRIRGKRIEFEAEQGPVEIKATADVVLRGEVIKLN